MTWYSSQDDPSGKGTLVTQIDAFKQIAGSIVNTLHQQFSPEETFVIVSLAQGIALIANVEVEEVNDDPNIQEMALTEANFVQVAPGVWVPRHEQDR